MAQSATLLDLLGERYQSALSHLALGRLVAETGARSIAERYLSKALGIFSQLGAERDVDDTRTAQALLTSVGTGQYLISPADADDAIVRRIVDAAALPDLLGRETAAALFEAANADCGVVYVELAGGDVRVVARRRLRPRRSAHARAVGRARHRLRSRRDDHRTARTRSGRRAVRSRRVAASRRPPGDAPAEDDRRRCAPGLRPVRRARSIRCRRSISPSTVRSNRCCPDFSRPAPR